MTNGLMIAGRIPRRVSVNPNLRAALGDHQIRDGAQARTAAQGRAVDPRDDRRRTRVDQLEGVGHRHRVLFVALDVERHRGPHPGDVGAGTERRAVPGQDDRPQVRGGLAGQDRERGAAAPR